VAPGVYNVTVKVTDGTQTTNVPLTFTVTQENATPTYTGPTTASAPADGVGVVNVGLTATVAEAADGNLGDLANATATFVDTNTSTTLCSSPVTSGGAAACSFNADSPKTYAIKVNVGGRYTGTTASDTNLVVTTSAPTGLQVTQPGNPSQSVQYSDAISAVGFSATSDNAGANLAALVDPATPLPNGLSLSARSGTNTAASWTVTGTADVAPGVYNVTVKVTDGTQTTNVPLTFTVTQENATATYTGPTTASAPSSGAGVVGVNLTATIAEATDGSPGNLTNATATFKDDTTGDTLCVSAVTAGGSASCSFNADSPRTYTVKVLVSGRYTGSTASNTNLVVSTTSAPVPDTTITGGPVAWLLDTVASWTFTSTEPGSTFTCTFDLATQVCGSPFTKSGLAAGTHVFTVAASKAGQDDATPARAVTTVPVDDAKLKDKKGVWLRKHNRGSFMKTFSSVHKHPGATLTYKVKNARSLALIATTGQKAGSVKVYLGSTLLKTVNLKGTKQNKVVFDLGTFLSPTSGKLRIVTQTRKPVRIDGLGVATQL
jgi:DNA polymerase-3 subunit gamma/tau